MISLYRSYLKRFVPNYIIKMHNTCNTYQVAILSFLVLNIYIEYSTVIIKSK